MSKTFTYVTDAVGNPEPITVQTVCSKVTVGENAQAGTGDFYLYGNEGGVASSTPVQYPAGKKKEFESPRGKMFQVGQILGFTAAVSGSLTMGQEEE